MCIRIVKIHKARGEASQNLNSTISCNGDAIYIILSISAYYYYLTYDYWVCLSSMTKKVSDKFDRVSKLYQTEWFPFNKCIISLAPV